MAGRGRSSILQALKEKKERERSESPSSVRQPLVTEPTPAVSAAAAAMVVEETTISTSGLTTGQASTSSGGARLPMGRGVGRGQLASLLATRQPAATITAPSITSPEKPTQPKEPTTIEPFEPPLLQKTSTLREVLY